MDLSHHHYDTGEVVLHYVRAGQGEPVLLLHGWPQSWYCWHKIMPALSERYSIIAPDLRGLGDSSRPLDGYDKATIAEDIRKLLHAHLNIDRYNIIAHDWGGPVAFVLAATSPQQVRKLVMLDTAVPGDGSGRPPLASCFPSHRRPPGGFGERTRGHLSGLVLSQLWLSARRHFAC
jgi:pimeloyl-ACP methyl ester carboxylesterase